MEEWDMYGASRCFSLVLALLSGFVLAGGAGTEQLRFELAAASEETYSMPHDIVLSPDGRLMYFHRRDGRKHSIWVTRRD